ncbi:hypothetical protein [Flavobacterium sp. 2]|uniref:hypothetical protein n=1 Tax=Flavobacterium sp. 2 TaxID=308053 RepID=UPI003CECBF38
MENRTEIGKAIRDHLNNLDKSPNDALWSKIEKDLNQKRRRRVLAWLIPSLIAVVLSCSLLYLKSDFQEKNQTQQTQQTKSKSEANTKNQTLKSSKVPNPKSILLKTEPDQITTVSKTKNVKLIKESSKLITSTSEYEEYEVVKKYKVVIRKEERNTKPIKPEAVKKTAKPGFSANLKKTSKEKTAKVNSKKTNKSQSTKQSKGEIKKSPFTPTPQKSIVQKDTLIIVKTETSPKITEIKKDSIVTIDSLKTPVKATAKREYKKTIYNTKTNELNPDVSIHAFYGPAIFGSLNGKSLINPIMDNLSKSHPVSSHYGVYVKTMFDKFGFRAGFSKINLKITTALGQNLITNYNNIDLKSDINIKDTFANSSDIELQQKLSYYEIPLDFNYVLKKDDTKFGIDAFTGFSFLILDKNELYLKSEKVEKQTIGEAKNISGVNISYDLGIGFTYKLTDKIGLDLNPIFKYYLNTFKENGETKPYSLSLQTGINYKF